MTQITGHIGAWRLLRDAAHDLELSKRTLFRLMKSGMLPAVKDEQTGNWKVRTSDLHTAPTYTLGRAAQRLGVAYETIRRWACANRIQTIYGRSPKDGSSTGKRRISLAEIDRIKQGRAR